MNVRQRVALLVALGAVFLSVAAAFEAATSPLGWLGYSPDALVEFSPMRYGGWGPNLGVRFVLATAWGIVAVVVLRDLPDEK